MNLRNALLACGLLLAPAAASAAVFTIPLPEALGVHPCEPGCSGVITFHLPGLPSEVHGISMHVVGTTEVGLTQCDDTPGSPPFPWPTTIEGLMQSSPNHYWDAYAQMPTVAGPFDWSATFINGQHPPQPPDWAFLSDGVGELYLVAGPAPSLLGCVNLTPPPTLTVTGAWLTVDADIPVPVHTESWGQLKAAYR